mgnify:CR=1 FL=1
MTPAENGVVFLSSSGSEPTDLEIVATDGSVRWLRVQHGPGFDGRGQALVQDSAGLEAAWRLFGERQLVAEQTPFDEALARAAEWTTT